MRSCSSPVFMEEPAKPISPLYAAALVLVGERQTGGRGWWVQLQRPMRPMFVAGSARGAVPAVRRARFPGPPSEPGVPVIPAPGSPPGPLPTTVVLPLGSAVPALDCQPDAGIHRRLLPCRRATAASLCPSPCAHRWRARTPTGTPPRPATTSQRRACPPPNGRGGRRRVASHHHHHHHPVDEVGASSTRQPRQGTPQPFPLASPTGHYKPAAESPAAVAAGVHC